MRNFIWILLFSANPILSLSQQNATIAPIIFNINEFEFKDSLVIIFESLTLSFTHETRFEYNSYFNFKEDSVIRIRTNKRNQVVEIETSLYIAIYKYRFFKKLTSLKIEYNEYGNDILHMEGYIINKVKYHYKKSKLMRATSYCNKSHINGSDLVLEYY
jgi:hypothetical protein